MSNFANEDGETTYTEPEGTEHYVASITMASEYVGDYVGLALRAVGNDGDVALGIDGEADVQQFLYAAAVHSKLIADGEPLILMKKITADMEGDHEVR